jgi:hypothetical protein
MMVRFRTDATAISVHYTLSKNVLGMTHVPATAVSGVDLYARDADGKWKWVMVTMPATQEMKTRIINGLARGYREYTACLPLFNGVDFLNIGVTKGSKFEGLALVRSPSFSTAPALPTEAAPAAPAWCTEPQTREEEDHNARETSCHLRPLVTS